VPKSQPKSNSEEATTTTLTPNKREAIKKEIAKLLAAGFINEVYHTEWLANPVLVLKKNINE
jgi:ribulose bisphosphate carboxylase small subunit